MTRRIGLISDTHGLLRPQALAFLHGCEHILHAGDIGDPAILTALARVAPTTAVRGNNDGGAWAAALPEIAVVAFAGVRVQLLHDLAALAIDPRTTRTDVVVSGHSHRPSVETRDGVVYVNPGSAGRRRFRLPIAVGELLIDGGDVSARVIELDG